MGEKDIEARLDEIDDRNARVDEMFEAAETRTCVCGHDQIWHSPKCEENEDCPCVRFISVAQREGWPSDDKYDSGHGAGY